MKKNWMAVALTMAMAMLTFVSCSSDDNSDIPSSPHVATFTTDAYQMFYWLENEKSEVTTTFKEGENILFHIKIVNTTNDVIRLCDERNLWRLMDVFRSDDEYVGNPFDWVNGITEELRWFEVGKDGYEFVGSWLYSNMYLNMEPLPKGSYYCRMRTQLLKKVVATDTSGSDEIDMKIPFIVI